MDNPELTKMAILRLFNLANRRQIEGFRDKNLSTFRLKVAKIVKFADRSGINLRGDKNDPHIRQYGEGFESRLVAAISDLQSLLYSSDMVSVKSVQRVLNEIYSHILPSLADESSIADIECEKKEVAPSLFLCNEASKIDFDTAVIIIIEALILMAVSEDLDSQDLARQFDELLRKPRIGKRILDLMPSILKSDSIWLLWKSNQQGKDLHRAPLQLSENAIPSDDNSINFPEIHTDGNFDASLMDGDLSQWAQARMELLE